MFRSLSVALLITLPGVTLQLLSMLAVLGVPLLGTAYFLPWRVTISNYIEITFTVALQFLVATAGFYADVEPDHVLSWVCVMVLSVVFFSIPPLMMFCLFRYVSD